MAYDCIVIGVGGMGSAALYHLAKRGLRVVGIEQFDIAHDRGSSHGQTRLLRKSYFEHPDYVPLLHRAYEMWAELEQASGTRLYRRTGLLLVGPPEGEVVSGVRRTAKQHQLDIEEVAATDFGDRFPGFVVGEHMAALFEPDAGYLEVENCVRAHVQVAEGCGARIATGQIVRQWQADARSVTVETDAETYTAAKLVICAGAWSAQVLAGLGLPLEVRRKVVMWFDADAIYNQARGCPVFCFDKGDDFFYGFPAIDEDGLKVALHSGGEVVEQPEQLDRELREADRREIEPFLAEHLPKVGPTLKRSSVCMYTMTPDEHFIIDRHPEHAHVAFAAGFSGHGFKFAPVAGSVLADLVIDGRTDEAVGFLSVSRPALVRAELPD